MTRYICPYCGIEVIPTGDPYVDEMLATGMDGSTYCPPGTPGQEDKVFPLHSRIVRP